MGHRSVLHYQSVTARRAKNIPCNTGTEDEHDRFYLTVLPLNYAMVLGNTWRVLLRNVFLSCDAVIVSILRSSSSNNVFDIFILCIPEWVHFGVATREKRKSENAIRGCKETGYQKNSGNLRYQHSGDQSSIIFLVPRKITSLGRFIHGLEINWYTIGLLILYVLVKDIDNHVINSKMFVCVIVERHKTGSNTHFLWMVLLVTENIKNIANDNFYEHFLNDSYQKLVFVTNGQ
ncbi:hypothetical protein GLOIN_2v1484907 [Rhizophagus irregularis DAOM 181602=DAOM 197198]|uniref:Uncharacterized protein n=1 Tax=Rhizophagus irregularis (strain DAOM 181602 / DAOM 197198 / MUCL 43194) TaxID=747089 RepID=A0A2P4PCM7_RHIID|nr:hypothetical protein GLOIN_2v1484907 [Rhizophagus irregularis DAOM 181602=DAOM 197198]POG63141.1 hypothetical protein GLOIN_2v1484907 [Rhizophagus irregularis DAOM 181602=DAOM 197198]GBC39204.2 hypothetical protein GLOIN_2v1484907 [Rhizophagus irregularis DAOM 181602=DAOM 197198]|eukprot:XP_025170007.1 hypothetical protein GLOIN_2v1484907 [Rhizophagus irregularis DAOM 181602=DAOM 197198]